MRMEDSLEALHKRCEFLLQNRAESNLSEACKREIAAKFANKSFQELNELAHELVPLNRYILK